MTTPVFTGAAARHVTRFLHAIRPVSGPLKKQFLALLHEQPYDTQQVRAFLGITPAAASRAQSTGAFFEQVHEHSRFLAKMNVPPAEVHDALREFDKHAGRALNGMHAPAREQLQLATMLVLQQAYYDVRESEAQAFYGLYRVEWETASLDDVLRRGVRILTQALHARSGCLLMMENLPDRRLGRPLYVQKGNRAEQVILDEQMRGRYKAYWSYPLPGVGIAQFGFAERRRWLPRDRALLDAAAERFRQAIEYRRMHAQARQAEETERRRIGRELHDEAGQSLLLLRMDLERIERDTPKTLRPRLRGARALAEKTVEEVRRVVAALSPAMLERLGLPAALRQLALRFRRIYRSRVGIQLSESAPLPMEIQQVIYRVAQECLQNAAKHSRATRVNLSLAETDKSIELRVSDNGAGFRAEAEELRARSFGLEGMQERAVLFGGGLTIRSAPGKGVTVTLRLPRDAVRAMQNGKDSRTSHG